MRIQRYYDPIANPDIHPCRQLGAPTDRRQRSRRGALCHRLWAASCLALAAASAPLGAACTQIEPPPLTIANATPKVISNQVATTLVIQGSGLLPTPRVDLDSDQLPAIDRTLRVTLGDVELEQVELISETTLQAVVPANVPAGLYDLTVAKPNGASSSLAGAVTVVDQAVTAQYRRSLTISPRTNCTSNLMDFPLLVSLPISGTDTYLKWVAEGGHVHYQDGRDIRFFAEDGMTALDHEVESYDASTGRLTAWVRVPAISTFANTVIHLSYGDARVGMTAPNPEAVWKSQYVAVWHFDPARRDSTGNGNHLQGPPRTASPAPFGHGEPLNAVDGELSLADTASLRVQQFTMSGWFRADAVVGIQTLFSKPYVQGTAVAKSYHVILDGNQPRFRSNASGASIAFPAPVSQGAWTYLAATHNGVLVTLYQYDTGMRNSSVGGGTITYDGSPLLVGADDNSTAGLPRPLESRFLGMIDEWRIMNTAQTSCWIETEYSNQSQPGRFIDVGMETTLP